jgi:tetratricopeptide (TPR) repeat protein
LTHGARDAPERQRTLQATIAWSYELLEREERELFARLAVFVGGCTLEAAEQVCEANLDTLASLVDRSLLRQSGDRFWMLETIREYALEALEESSSIRRVRDRHADYFLALAERVDLESRTGDQSAWFECLDADAANLRAALESTREAGAAELTLRLATALWGFWHARGHVTEGIRRLEEALAVAREPPARTLLGLCALRTLAPWGTQELLDDAREALSACEQLGDDFSLAQAWNVIGKLESGLGDESEAERCWERALEYAERGNYPSERGESMGWLMIMSVFGPLPTDQGIERCKAFFERAGDDPKVRAFAQVERSVLEAMRGEFELARRLLTDGTHIFEALGLNIWAANNAQEVFYVEMLAGNPRAASAALRNSFAALERMEERAFLSTIAGFLAHTLYALGEDEESERFSRLSDEAASYDDVLSQVLWRTARAKVCARRGELERAVDLAREAVDLARPTELLNTQADALIDLGEVLQLADRAQEARAVVGKAASKYEQKGNLVSLATARRRLDALTLLMH